MKRRHFLVIFANVLCAFGLLAAPLAAVAEGQMAEPEAEQVIITEIQTGAAAAGDEFVELYNPADLPADITGWQIRYANAGNQTTTLLATVAASDAQAVILPPHAYYTLHTASVTVAGAGQDYGAGLAKTDKTVALFAADQTTCQMVVADAVAWALPAAGATNGEGQPIDSTDTSTKEKLLQRVRDAAGDYVDTDNNDFDFVMSASLAGSTLPAVTNSATPGADNVVLLSGDTVLPDPGSGSLLAPLAISGCVVPPEEEPDPEPDDPLPEDSPPSVNEPPAPDPEDETPVPVIPPGNAGLKPPMLSELLPNPASPLTDQDDEFIELYNPNDAYFDLSGYVLEVGLKTKRLYIIPQGTGMSPRSFLALFSVDTNLALSNSGSQVLLADPLGKTLAVSEVYATAKDGQSWVLANGRWQWTTRPTPNALNIVSAPQVKKASAKKPKAAAAVKTSASSSQPKDSNGEADVQTAAAVASTSSTPLHPGVLALIAFSALLYGAYEYRHDVANKLYQFRSNRAARRASGESPKGR